MTIIALSKEYGLSEELEKFNTAINMILSTQKKRTYFVSMILNVREVILGEQKNFFHKN